jgi:hypothetical protein
MSMIGRPFRATPQHGVSRMFLRRQGRHRDIVPHGDAVVVEGEENTLSGIQGKDENKEEATREFHDTMIRSPTRSGKTDLLVSFPDQMEFPPLSAACPH